jgi:hypothetical protein
VSWVDHRMVLLDQSWAILFWPLKFSGPVMAILSLCLLENPHSFGLSCC